MRHTTSAAWATLPETPMLWSSAIMSASVVPRPPGVIGTMSMIWLVAKAPKAASGEVPANPHPSTPRKAA